MHPAQSASEKALIVSKVTFDFLDQLAQYSLHIWHALFTAKAMSGPVNVKYFKAPATLLYLELSSELSGSPL
jgi:hypothetical protein